LVGEGAPCISKHISAVVARNIILRDERTISGQLARDASQRVRVEALRNVSLGFSAGDRVALVGSSGAGKTTLMCDGRHLRAGGRRGQVERPISPMFDLARDLLRAGTWRRKPCNPSTTRSARGCHPKSQVRSVTHVSGPDKQYAGGRGVLHTISRHSPSSSLTYSEAPIFIGVSNVFVFLVPSSSSTITRMC
jgi:hypothetical protein